MKFKTNESFLMKRIRILIVAENLNICIEPPFPVLKYFLGHRCDGLITRPILCRI